MNVIQLESRLRDMVRTDEENVVDLAECLQSVNERVKVLEAGNE